MSNTNENVSENKNGEDYKEDLVCSYCNQPELHIPQYGVTEDENYVCNACFEHYMFEEQICVKCDVRMLKKNVNDPDAAYECCLCNPGQHEAGEFEHVNTHP